MFRIDANAWRSRSHYGPDDHGSEGEETRIFLANREGDKGCRANCCRQNQLVKSPIFHTPCTLSLFSIVYLSRRMGIHSCAMCVSNSLTDPSGQDCVLQISIGISRNMVDTCTNTFPSIAFVIVTVGSEPRADLILGKFLVWRIVLLCRSSHRLTSTHPGRLSRLGSPYFTANLLGFTVAVGCNLRTSFNLDVTLMHFLWIIST